MNEKIYFRRHCEALSAGKDSGYLKLFDAISEQQKYDEGELKKQFREETFVRQFTFAKNYLYGLILKSLRGYHSRMSVSIRLKNLIHNAEILYEKGLYASCRKMLSSARRLAETFGENPAFLDIIRLEGNLINVGEFEENPLKKINDLKSEESRRLKLQENLSHYWHLSAQLLHYLRISGTARSKKESKKLDAIMQDPLLLSEARALTFPAKLFYHNTLGAYYFHENNPQLLFKILSRLILLLESRPDYIREAPVNYISVLNNYMIVCLQLKKTDLFKNALQKMKNVRSSHPDIQLRIFTRSSSVELKFCILEGNFGTGLSLVPAIENGLERFRKSIDSHLELSIYFDLAYLCFGAGEFKKSLFWLNRILNRPWGAIREDLQSSARILSLLIHYELENLVSLEYFVRSAYRYLSKKECLYQSEELLLGFLKQIPRFREKSEILSAFTELRNALLKMKKDKPEKYTREQLDLISWLESKISGKLFGEIVKEKYLNAGND